MTDSGKDHKWKEKKISERVLENKIFIWCQSTTPQIIYFTMESFNNYGKWSNLLGHKWSEIFISL